MNYLLIHNKILDNAKSRQYNSKIHHNHHIKPKHEDNTSFEVVPLTIKEHYLIHYLRYKIGYGMGNYKAYLLLKYGKVNMNILQAKLGAIAYHKNFKKTNPELYKKNQIKAGVSGGKKCYENKIGFFNLTESELNVTRNKGRKTVVENKLGMFSDNFRQQHKKKLNKKIIIDELVFDSMMSVSKHFNISQSLVTYRVKSEKWSNWNYLKESSDE